MLITMLADRFLAGGVLCAKGTQVDVATEQALRWIGDNVAAPVGLARETAQGIRRDVPVLQDQIGGQQSAAGAPVSGAGNSDADITVNNRDGQGRVTSYTQGGVTYTVTYTPAGNVNTVSGGAKITTYSYDASGLLTGSVTV